MNTLYRYSWLWLLICASWFTVHAQAGQADSLIAAAEAESVDSTRGRLLFEAAQQLLYSEPARALEVAGEAGSTLAKEGATPLLAKVIGLQANCHYIIGQREEARRALAQAIEVYEQVGDSTGAAVSRLNLGILYKVAGLLDSTLAVIERSLETFTRNNDTVYIGNALQLRGTVRETRGYQSLALEDYLQALALHRAAGSNRAIAEDLMTLSALYFELGDYTKAREGYAEASERYEEMNNLAYLAQAQTYLGAAEKSLGNTQRSEELYRSALQLSRETRNVSNEARTAYHLAILLNAQGKLVEAANHIEAAMKGFRQTNNQEFLGLAELEAFGIYRRRGLVQPALSLLDSAESHISQSGSLSSLIKVEDARSQYLLDTRQFESASASLLRLTTYRDSLSNVTNRQRIEEL